MKARTALRTNPDGYTVIDDLNEWMYPGAPEFCDGLDNNCNVQRDEGLPQSEWYVDVDDAGWGASACAPPDGYTDISYDKSKNPSAGTCPWPDEL